MPLEILYEVAVVLNQPRRNVPMPRADVTIKTRDGNCPASLFTPASGKGPWPGDFLSRRFGRPPGHVGDGPAAGRWRIFGAAARPLLSLWQLPAESGSRGAQQSAIDGRTDEMGEQPRSRAQGLGLGRSSNFFPRGPRSKESASVPPAIVWAATPA